MKCSNRIGDRAGAIFRLYMGGNACVTWFMALNEPRSIMSTITGTGAGELLVWLLLFVGLATVADAVINDLLPERYHWRVALRQRNFLLTGMAFCYMAQLYVGFYSLHSTALLVYYLWNTVMLMFVAFVDAHQRSRDATCVIICN